MGRARGRQERNEWAALRLAVGQGVGMCRPSELHMAAGRAGGGICVRVGGGVVPVSRGVVQA